MNDLSADLPQPPVSEASLTPEPQVASEVSPVLKLIEAEEGAERAAHRTWEAFVETKDKAQKLAELAEGRLPIISEHVNADNQKIINRQGVLVTLDARKIQLKTLRASPWRTNEDRVEVLSMRFTDPADPERNIAISHAGIELSFKDRPTFVVHGRDYDYGQFLKDQQPPNRDPLDAAREGLDYFLQHADELRLVEPAAPVPPAPQTPPPAPSTPAV